MSQQNVEIVREVMMLVDSARNGDLDHSVDALVEQISDLTAPDAEIDMSRRIFNPDVYRGTDGLRRLLEEVRGAWGEFHVTPERIVDAGDRVVVIEAVRARGRGSGVQVERQSASIWTLRDGRIVGMEMRREPREALEAVGLEA